MKQLGICLDLAWGGCRGRDGSRGSWGQLGPAPCPEMASTSEARAAQTYCRRGRETEAEARVEVGPVGAGLNEPGVGTTHGKWLRGGSKHQGSGLRGFCRKKTHQSVKLNAGSCAGHYLPSCSGYLRHQLFTYTAKGRSGTGLLLEPSGSLCQQQPHEPGVLTGSP